MAELVSILLVQVYHVHANTRAWTDEVEELHNIKKFLKRMEKVRKTPS
jgi:hypothetical protein